MELGLFALCLLVGWVLCHELLIPAVLSTEQMRVELIPVAATGGFVAAIASFYAFPWATRAELMVAALSGACAFLAIVFAFANPAEANPRIIRFPRVPRTTGSRARA